MARLDLGGLAFAALALLTLGSAAVVAFARNVIHATVALAGTLFGVAGLYALLATDFVAAVQVLVYVGGTLVLFLFAAMLTVRIDRARSSTPSSRRLAGYVTLLLVGALTTIAIRHHLADRRGRFGPGRSEARPRAPRRAPARVRARVAGPRRDDPRCGHGRAPRGQAVVNARMIHPTLSHYLVVGAILFGLGLFTVITRRNAVGMLLGVELVLNAAALNFVAFDHFGAEARASGPHLRPLHHRVRGGRGSDRAHNRAPGIPDPPQRRGRRAHRAPPLSARCPISTVPSSTSRSRPRSG